MKEFQHIYVIAFLFLVDFTIGCSTCYGDPNSDAGKGMDMAIFTLLGVVGIISIGLKSKKMNQLK